LFLDEIGDMPLGLQAKLLRALQEGEIEPLGSNKLIPFDARVIAATSRDLNKLVREGNFREDLFYRLNVLPIRVPPLRERREDIAALVEVLGEDMSLRSGEQPPELSADALALLSAQLWRGNIRELRNVLEQATMRSDSHRILPSHLQAVLSESGVEQLAPMALTKLPVLAATRAVEPVRPLAEQVAALERQAIASAMAAAGGNKVVAAKMLGISRAKLYGRIGEFA
jgi:transcriptional regulator with GAF, ATPase, and Fis domain